MTFTKTPPTVAGFYAWRPNETQWTHCEVLGPTGIGTIEAAAMGGEWCRLIPAEEVEKSYREGFQDRNAFGNKAFEDESFGHSRAKRVAEGME